MVDEEYVAAWNQDEPQRAGKTASANPQDTDLQEYVAAHRALDEPMVGGPILESKVEATPLESADKSPAPMAKPAVVSKAQLEAFQRQYGANKTLTDYMNHQKGLTSRGNPTLGEAKDADEQAAADRIDPSKETNQRAMRDREAGNTRGRPAPTLSSTKSGMTNYGPRDAVEQARQVLRSKEIGNTRGRPAPRA